MVKYHKKNKFAKKYPFDTIRLAYWESLSEVAPIPKSPEPNTFLHTHTLLYWEFAKW